MTASGWTALRPAVRVASTSWGAEGNRSGSWGPQNVPLPLGVKRKVITAATAAALIIDIIYRIPVPAQFGSRPDAPADCFVFQVHDPDPSTKVKDCGGRASVRRLRPWHH